MRSSGSAATLGQSSLRPVRACPPSPVTKPFVPSQVAIASLAVQAPVGRVGLDRSRHVQVPVEPSQAGWYTGSGMVGQARPTVIVGHVDSVAGPGVFFGLAKVRVGQTVVLRSSGTACARFTVTRVVQVAKSAFPTQQVYAPTVTPQLRLVTCGGAFNPSMGSYHDNVIVFATLDQAR